MLSNSPPSSESNAARGIVAKVFGTFFFSIFAAAGLALTGVMLWSFGYTLRPYLWKQTPCTIIESRQPGATLEKTPSSDESIVIRYRYDAGGRSYESDRLEGKGMKETLDSRRIERLLMKYQVGTSSFCYVNPKNPEEAVLQRGVLWPLVFALIPLIFVAVGVGGIIGVWRGEEWKRRAAARARTSKSLGTAGKLFFFGVFLLLGGILAYFVAVRPVLKHFAAKNWPATPCEIVSSSVGSHRGSKGGTTYSVDISYRYQVDGRDYQSDTYSVMGGSSSGRSSKERVVARYPEGSQAVCYVNPEDPTDSLLNRDLSPFLFIGLIPGLFFVVGLVGVVSTIRSALKGVLARSASPVLPGVSGVVPAMPLPITPSMVGIGPTELKPEYSPLTKLAGAMFGALFWNGITGVFVWFAIDSIIKQKPEWFLIVFITPFVLIGLLLIGLVGSTFLNLFNPRMRLTVNSPSILLGDKLQVSWAFTSSSDRIKRFKIALEGREDVSHGTGKNRRTNSNVFVTLPLVETDEPLQIAKGQASVEIPTHHKPSDDEGSRKVIWTLRASGEIPRYPDFEEAYEITVLAREVRQNEDFDFED